MPGQNGRNTRLGDGFDDEFNEENGVTLMQFAVPGNKEPPARRLLSERTRLQQAEPGRAR